MKRMIEALVAPALVLSLVGCGTMEDEKVDGTECAELSAIINHDLPEAGFVVRLALDNVGDNSIRGDTVEVLQASDDAVCDRFLGSDESLHIHSNYNKLGFLGLSSERVFTCGIEEQGQRNDFGGAKGRLSHLLELDPDTELIVTGLRRSTYTGTDGDGNAKYEKRDICTTIQVLPR